MICWARGTGKKSKSKSGEWSEREQLGLGRSLSWTHLQLLMNMGENRCGAFPTLLSMFGGCSDEGQLDDLLGLHHQVKSKSGNWVESPACVQLVVEVTVLSPFFIGIRSLCLMLFFWSEVVHPSWRLHDGMRWPGAQSMVKDLVPPRQQETRHASEGPLLCQCVM
jgi:hypothetical protein